MWILNEMKRGDTVKGRNQFRRKKKVFRKSNYLNVEVCSFDF